jgi:hypothetical protein
VKLAAVGFCVEIGKNFNWRGRKMKKNLFLLLPFVFFSSIANAGIATLSLPSLNGLYTGSFGGPGRKVNANFETEFLSIDEVRIHLIGNYTSGTGHNYNGQPGSVYGELMASMPGWAIWPRILHPFETSFNLNLRFFPFMNPEEDWSILLDGDADISFRLSMGTPCDVIDHLPEINVTFAELIVEGTPVPEPCTLMLLGVGGILIRKR